ncbi:hypothetical protein SAMD00023353_1700050 [Rosellinia necatrix]|uniref:Uncharacterized protein n=1 Tax=Rosellinia necatrix TaxID=77044 RepID=A0A1W2TKW0_ROSNE|nr:hypothetical protein SAMD00023353_1700050 [Rosellinia necatrix]
MLGARNTNRVILDHLDESSLTNLPDVASSNLYDARIQLTPGLFREPPEDMYRMTFRYVKCRGPYQPIVVPRTPHRCDVPVPCWPSSLSPKVLRGWWTRYRNYTYFPPCCGTQRDPNDLRVNLCGTALVAEAFRFDEEIYAFIYDYTHAMLAAAQVKGGLLWIARARIVWAAEPPAPHSIAVTREHLELVQQRGHIDHIHVDFRYDPSGGIFGAMKRSIGKLSAKLNKWMAK